MSARKTPRPDVWSYRGCCTPRRGHYKWSSLRREIGVLLVILEARLRDESTDVAEVLSVLWDLSEVLPFAAPKVAARAAEKARLLVFAGYTPALSKAARRVIKLGDISPQHPAYIVWAELAEATEFHEKLDSMTFPPEPLPEWLGRILH
jgi:hypothetical protein